MWRSYVCLLLLVALGTTGSRAENKYSKEANTHSKPSQFVDEPDFKMRDISKPFRMAKLNLLWTKAQVRLTEPKLKSLYSELKVHDKEELLGKKLKAEGKDKEGIKEADLRRKLIGVMSTYGLLEHFEDLQDAKKFKDHEPLTGKSDIHMNKSLFKDKKLNKLWAKAETAGFTTEELMALKEEFMHHQDKVDQYYSILSEVEEGDKDTDMNSIDDKLEKSNEINAMDETAKPNKDYFSKVNHLRDHHRDVRDDYDRLYRITMMGPNSQEFIEPKVQGLWKLAMNANFTADELASLKTELFHYEKRLLKLRHMQVDAAMNSENRKGKPHKDKVDSDEITEDVIKKHSRKVAKLHSEIESKIMRKHAEL